METISQMITPNDFYNKRHRIIAESMYKLYNSGEIITVTLLADELQKKDNLNVCGGRVYLAQLMESEIGSVHIAERHAKIIKEKATRRNLIYMLHETLKSAESEDIDNDQVLSFAEGEIFKLTQHIGEDRSEPLSETVPRLLETIHLYQKGEMLKNLITTRFKDLNDIIQGFVGGESVIIASNPGWGKSELAIDIGFYNAYERQKSVEFWSLEMSADSLTMRVLSKMTGITTDDMRRKGRLSSDDWDNITRKANAMAGSPLYIDDCPFLSTDKTVSKARKAKSKRGIDLLIVDYMQLMKGKGERRDLEVGDISRTLKSVAMDLKIPVISLSQLSRDNMKSNRKPQLSDLRESGSIEQDADVVLFPYHGENNYSSIIVGKRRNGARGEVPMVFNNGHWDSISYQEEPKTIRS